ncbi:MAG: hypothetical protein H6818_23640 [Phycisphaerales bacterium]|nr:hypothetical protein [Phycisphaerales bacterium]MCB9864462.1 hypothetical protein [Phycisphaerales bacterium]
MTIRSRHIAMLLLTVVVVHACGDAQVQSIGNAVLPDSRVPPPEEIALVEHRGKFYSVKDLTDPTYVAQSDDPFVKNFAENQNVAVEWAGMLPQPSVGCDYSFMYPPPSAEYSQSSDTFSRR